MMLCMPALLFPHMLPRLHAFDPQSTAHCTSSHNGQTRASASPRTGRPLWVSSRRIPISVEAVSTSSEVLPSRTRGLSVFGSSRQLRDAVQALPRRHAWVVTGVLHTSPCGVRGRQSVAGESLRGRVAAVLIAVRVGSGRRGWFRPLFVGLGRDGLRSCLRGEEDDIRPRDGTAG